MLMCSPDSQHVTGVVEGRYDRVRLRHSHGVLV